MSTFKRFGYAVSIFTTAAAFTFFGLFTRNMREACLVLAIIMLAVAFHLIIRLVLVNLCEYLIKNLNVNEKRFIEKPFERKLYKFLKVHRWKTRWDVFDESAYLLKYNSVDELLEAGCCSEITHFLCALTGFVSILFTFPFGHAVIYIVTSVLGAVFDLLFVAVQRYNRPRLKSAAEKGVN